MMMIHRQLPPPQPLLHPIMKYLLLKMETAYRRPHCHLMRREGKGAGETGKNLLLRKIRVKTLQHGGNLGTGN